MFFTHSSSQTKLFTLLVERPKIKWLGTMPPCESNFQKDLTFLPNTCRNFKSFFNPIISYPLLNIYFSILRHSNFLASSADYSISILIDYFSLSISLSLSQLSFTSSIYNLIFFHIIHFSSQKRWYNFVECSRSLVTFFWHMVHKTIGNTSRILCAPHLPKKYDVKTKSWR